MARTTAVITGASSGIGEVFARKLAAEHDLLLVARRKEKLEALAAELRERYGTAVAVLQADLADEQGLQNAAERIEAEENLGLLVNNAGFGAGGLFWEADLGRQEEMHRLHVMAVVRLTHVALKKMVAKNAGGIINVASVAALCAEAGRHQLWRDEKLAGCVHGGNLSGTRERGIGREGAGAVSRVHVLGIS